jgi:hypothetical protein
MRSVQVLSAVALAAGVVSAQRASTCTDDVKITQPTQVVECQVVAGDLIIDQDLTGDVLIDGPETIRGDFRAVGSSVVGISSSTIETVEGTFNLTDLAFLSSVSMSALRNLDVIGLLRLNSLNTLTFGTTGVTSASDVDVIDTNVADLSGLNLATVRNFRIQTNSRLENFNSDLVNITGQLIVEGNGLGSGRMLGINMTRLQSASEIQMTDVNAFNAPRLSNVDKSLKFTNNPLLKSFKGDNITEIGESLTFDENDKLTNISFKLLESVGDLSIRNNSKLLELNTLPELTTIRGALILAGVFESVDLPSLQEIKGTATVTSTTDIQEFCDYFKGIEDNGNIEGESKCTSNNDAALENGEGGQEDTGSTSGGNNSDTGDDGAAAGLSVNMAVLGLAVVAGLAQLL